MSFSNRRCFETPDTYEETDLLFKDVLKNVNI